jgi:hypothetical protein
MFQLNSTRKHYRSVERNPVGVADEFDYIFSSEEEKKEKNERMESPVNLLQIDSGIHDACKQFTHLN